MTFQTVCLLGGLVDFPYTMFADKVTGFPQALEIMENHEKKFHAWESHGI